MIKYPEQVLYLIKLIRRQEHEVTTTMDELLPCPKCTRRSLEYSSGWRCLWRDCQFQTYDIPSKDQVIELLNLRRKRKEAEELELLEGLEDL